MTAFLLDVNVLVALAWPGHEAHERVQAWFARSSALGWATCPFTQSAFVRIVSNPAFSSRAVSLQDAVGALNASTKHPAHRFQVRLVGHQQVTDAYLLGLALHKKGRLATLDRSIATLMDTKSTERDGVEVIPKNF